MERPSYSADDAGSFFVQLRPAYGNVHGRKEGRGECGERKDQKICCNEGGAGVLFELVQCPHNQQKHSVTAV